MIFLAPEDLYFCLQVIRRNMTGVWLASTAWAVHSSIVTLPGIQTIGTVLGFTDMTQSISLLSPYVRQLFTNMEEERLKMQLTQPDADVSPLENPCPGCWSLSPANVSIVETELVQRTAFSVYSAVYSVAYALHDMLGCNASMCTEAYKKENIYPWQVGFQSTSIIYPHNYAKKKNQHFLWFYFVHSCCLGYRRFQ